MKRVYLSVILGAMAMITQIHAQNVVFNDALFKSLLVGNSSINTDMDTNVSVAEAVAYTGSIYVSEYGIYDLTGIEEFINLTGLYANYNNISSVDLSQNTLLTGLDLGSNNLTTIDLSANTSLQSISLSGNMLTSIVFPPLTTITDLNLGSNNLTSLDVSGAYNLATLNVYNNQLTSLNVTGCYGITTLDCGSNQLTCLDVSTCYFINYLYCYNNSQLTALNVKNGNNGAISSFDATSNPLLTCIQVDDATYSDTNWLSVDTIATFNTDCGIPTISFTSSTPACVGSPITFTSTGTNLENYSWNFDDGNTDTVANPVHTYTNGGFFNVQVSTSNCYGSASANNYYQLGSAIYGSVVHTPSINQGDVYLLAYDSIYGAFDTVDTRYLEGPSFDFQGVNPGQYIILVVPDTSQYPDVMPTFHYNEVLWDSADVITIGCAPDTTIQVVIADQVTLPVGSGLLHGTIIEGPGFGRAQGDPIHGVDVKLGVTATAQMVGATTTDNNGEYNFGLVPFGTYTIFVNIPGLLRDSSYTITIDTSNYQYLNLDYIVDSNSIYIVNPMGLEDNNEASEFNVFPNPSTDNLFVAYTLNQDSRVKLEIYNLMGVQLKSYINADQPAGKYTYQINRQVSQLGSGIYLASLTVNGKTTTRKIILID